MGWPHSFAIPYIGVGFAVQFGALKWVVPNVNPCAETLRSPSFSGVRGTGFVVSSVVIVVVLVAMVTAFRSWRATRHRHSAKNNELLEVGGERTRFMAFAGVLRSAVFLFAVLMNALPLITNSVCMP
ncbi:MAG: hypothetical protein ACJ796_17030 [Gemmatimonadaceae bacterium]